MQRRNGGELIRGALPSSWRLGLDVGVFGGEWFFEVVGDVLSVGLELRDCEEFGEVHWKDLCL